jgi:membrane dipeptidase
MYIVDAHEDLAWNMLTFGRDYTKSAVVTRLSESGNLAQLECGDTLLGYDDYQRGSVCIVFSTLFASPIRRKRGDWDSQSYSNVEEANAIYCGQLDAYHRLCDQNPEKFCLIDTYQNILAILANWKDEQKTTHPIGLVVLMEGGEAVGNPEELEDFWQAGVHIIGPAWAGTRFCGGTGEPGPLTKEGYALLDGMAERGFTLDISHMDEQAALQAIDRYPQLIIASHANAKALLKGVDTNRHLSDQVIHNLIERGGVIGIVPLNPFLKAGWKKDDPRAEVTLGHVVAQIDYICQLAGDAMHVGIGTDFDGGFGVQYTPEGIDTIGDLQKLIPLLDEIGYSARDIQAVMGGNWIDRLKIVFPEIG